MSCDTVWMTRCLSAAIALSVMGITLGAPTNVLLPPADVPGSALPSAPRLIQGPAWRDRNENRIDDRLERSYRRTGQAGLQPHGTLKVADLMICLDHAPTAGDMARYRSMGALAVEGWSDLVDVVRVRFPAAQLSLEALQKLGQGPGVTWVEENAVLRAAGYFAMRQTRARTAWGYGAQGSPNQALAILDSGIDETHPDLAGRVIGWADFAGVDATQPGDEYLTPSDVDGHGTGAAGLAAGNGAAAGLATGVGSLNLTFVAPLAFALPNTLHFPVDTRAAMAARSVAARLSWQAALPNVFHAVQIARDSESGGALLGYGWIPATSAQPFALIASGVPSGLSSFFYQAAVGTSTSVPMSPLPAWLQISTPMSAAGDGFPLMRGVAPGCKLVGVKVLDDHLVGTIGILLNAVTWLNARRQDLGLVGASCSLVSDGPSAILDTLVDRLVGNGVLWVNAAGNDRERERAWEAGGEATGIFAPASAALAITVGATSEVDRVTNFSSYGREDQQKPDLMAPGGSRWSGRFLAVVDSNTADARGTGSGFVPDQFPGDYAAFGVGTSFSAAQVAGAAMLLASTMGNPPLTKEQILHVKALLLMTASETALSAEPADGTGPRNALPMPPQPVLNRGEKDRVEGFGRLNVDAAVEAATRSLPLGTATSDLLGPDALDRHVWARNVTLTGGTTYSFVLSSPVDADHDLYLYSRSPTASGEPQLAARSTQPTLGATEALAFTPPATSVYYVVVKAVAGARGSFQLLSSTAADFAVSVTPGIQGVEAKGDSASYQISVTGWGGFNTPVALSLATALPAGTNAQLTPATVNAGGSAVLTIETTAATPGPSVTLTIQGTARGTVRTALARLDMGAIWPRFHHDRHSSGRSAFAGPQTSRQPWLHEAGAPILSSPAVGGDETIYYGAQDGTFHAVRSSDGTPAWVFHVPGGASVDSSPAISSDGSIYFGAADGVLYALRGDGALRWRLALATGPVLSGPAIAVDGTIYVTAGGTLHAVGADGVRKWRFASGGSVSSSPSLGRDGTIYFGSGSATGTAANRLYALSDNGSSVTKKWEFAAVGQVVSTPLLAPNGRIYLGSTGDASGGRFAVLTDADTTATQLASFTTGGAIRSSPSLGADGSVYVGCDDGNLYAFNAAGGLKWRFPAAGSVLSSPAISGDGALYFGAGNRIYAVVDRGSTPAELWHFETGAEVLASPAIGGNGALYVPSLDGSLYAFRDSAPATFIVSVTPPEQVAIIGDTLSYTVRVKALNGFTAPIKFEVVGTLPSDVEASFDPPTVSPGNDGTGLTTLQLTLGTAIPAGQLSFRVRATSGGIVRETSLASAVWVDYALIGQPETQRITIGQSATYSVAVVPNPIQAGFLPMFVGVTARIAAGPTGGTAPAISISYASQDGGIVPDLLTLTCASSLDTEPGLYVIRVVGWNGAAVHTVQLQLEAAGFNVAATPSSQTLAPSSTTTFSISVERLFGFSEVVTLASSGTLPAGVTATFNPTNIAGSVASTLTVTTTAATPIGSHTLTLTGTTARGIIRKAMVVLVVR